MKDLIIATMLGKYQFSFYVHYVLPVLFFAMLLLNPISANCATKKELGVRESRTYQVGLLVNKTQKDAEYFVGGTSAPYIPGSLIELFLGSQIMESIETDDFQMMGTRIYQARTGRVDSICKCTTQGIPHDLIG